MTFNFPTKTKFLWTVSSDTVSTVGNSWMSLMANRRWKVALCLLWDTEISFKHLFFCMFPYVKISFPCYNVRNYSARVLLDSVPDVVATGGADEVCRSGRWSCDLVDLVVHYLNTYDQVYVATKSCFRMFGSECRDSELFLIYRPQKQLSLKTFCEVWQTGSGGDFKDEVKSCV